MPEFVFDGASFDEAVANLRESADLVDEVVTRTVLEIGEEFKETAKKLAGQHSASIPATIRTMPIPHGIAVRAGSAAVPLAALYELGNKGNGGRRSATFKHPVFGNRAVWVRQKRYPYFAPTRKLMRRPITERMGATWEEALAPFERGGRHV